MLDLKLPFLKPIDLDAAAGELLRRYSRWKCAVIKPPIDVDEIVEGYLGLELGVVDLEKTLGLPDVLGAAWFDEKRICVDQSLEGQEGRFSFTLAHEVGHWVLHRPLYEADKVTRPLFAEAPRPELRPPQPPIVCRQSQRQAPAEWQANQFAARLLMPAAHVRDAFRALLGRPMQVWSGLARALRADEIDPRLRALASALIAEGHFDNVSNEAMRRRLVALKLVVDRDRSALALR